MELSILDRNNMEKAGCEDSNRVRKELEYKMNQYWGQRSSSYSQQNMAQLFGDKREEWENIIFSQLKEDKVLNILDIGTGPGFFAILSAMRGHNVTAVDMSQDMLDKAKKNAKFVGAEAEFMQVGSILPFEDKTFDLIISRDVTWTLTDPKKQLKNWAMKLKEGGTMLYFDAEWYYYLKDAEYRKEWERKKTNIIKNGGFVYGKSRNLEELAINLPMTYEKRPLWDIKYWKTQKEFECKVDINLNPYIYNEKEQMQYEAFPEFLVCVRRKINESC